MAEEEGLLSDLPDDVSQILDVHPDVLTKMLADLDGEPINQVQATSVVRVETEHGVRERAVNSRFVRVSEQDVEKMLWEQENKNTKNSTKNWLKVFSDYLVAEKKQCDLKSVSASHLASILKFAYVSLKTQKGAPYAKSSLVSFRNAIQRELNNHKRNINIITGIEFVECNKVFAAYIKKLKSDGDLKAVSHKPPISEEDNTRSDKYFTDCTNDPLRLSRFIWFVVTKHFCMRGRESQSSLCIEDFETVKSDCTTTYIRMTTAHKEKNHQGSLTSADEVSDGRIVDSFQVSAFNLYISKLTKGTGEKTRLFQQVSAATRQRDTWYNGKPLGKNTLGSMMTQISEAAGLTVKKYTNHLVRASCITELLRQGLAPSTVMGISKHRSSASLASYDMTSHLKRTSYTQQHYWVNVHVQSEHHHQHPLHLQRLRLSEHAKPLLPSRMMTGMMILI